MLYHVRGGLLPVRRKVRHNPLLLNIQAWYLTTRVGTLSARVSDRSHQLFGRFGEWLVNRTSNYAWKRRWLYPLTLLGGFCWGYIVVA